MPRARQAFEAMTSEEEEYETDDDEAYETNEVMELRRMEQTRAEAVQYLGALGIASPQARTLAAHIQTVLSADELPGAVSDLIDRYGAGASPPVRAATSCAAVPPLEGGGLAESQRGPEPRQLATDVRQRTEGVIAAHASMRAQLSAANSARALATILRQHSALERDLTAGAQQLSAEYEMRPSRSAMAAAFEILVSEMKGATSAELAALRPNLASPTSAELFFSGVFLSRMTPADNEPCSSPSASAPTTQGSTATGAFPYNP